MKDKDLIICKCHSTEHQMVVLYEEDENHPMVYVHIHLNKQTFWRRLVYGVKYIFGRQSKYGAFDEIILNPEDADKFKKIYSYLSNEKTL
jgi:hypothetical protein